MHTALRKHQVQSAEQKHERLLKLAPLDQALCIDGKKLPEFLNLKIKALGDEKLPKNYRAILMAYGLETLNDIRTANADEVADAFGSTPKKLQAAVHKMGVPFFNDMQKSETAHTLIEQGKHVFNSTTLPVKVVTVKDHYEGAAVFNFEEMDKRRDYIQKTDAEMGINPKAPEMAYLHAELKHFGIKGPLADFLSSMHIHNFNQLRAWRLAELYQQIDSDPKKHLFTADAQSEFEKKITQYGGWTFEDQYDNPDNVKKQIKIGQEKFVAIEEKIINQRSTPKKEEPTFPDEVTLDERRDELTAFDIAQGLDAKTKEYLDIPLTKTGIQQTKLAILAKVGIKTMEDFRLIDPVELTYLPGISQGTEATFSNFAEEKNGFFYSDHKNPETIIAKIKKQHPKWESAAELEEKAITAKVGALLAGKEDLLATPLSKLKGLHERSALVAMQENGFTILAEIVYDKSDKDFTAAGVPANMLAHIDADLQTLGLKKNYRAMAKEMITTEKEITAEIRAKRDEMGGKMGLNLNR